MFTFLTGAHPAVYWSAVSIAAASLALFLSPYLVVAVFGQSWDVFVGPILLAFAASATIVASRSQQTKPIAAFTAMLLVLPLISYCVMIAYSLGLRIPLLLQNAAIVWPQLTFFSSTLWANPPAKGPVLPQEWAGVITIAFWMLVALGFRRITRQFASFTVLVALAIVTIVSTIFLVKPSLPLFDWRLLLEFP